MEQSHSTLELVKHDETAKAPERVLDANALAPQVAFDTGPLLLYNNSFPEVLGEVEDSAGKRVSSHHTTKAACKWPWMVVALVVAVAIAVGTGVGIWRHREHSPKISPKYILNDTSLAALSFTNGDRHLYFQGNTGLIHRAIRSASNGRWITNTSSGLSSNGATSAENPVVKESWPKPRNNTPLAVTAVVDPQGGTNTEVFYVSDSHYLSSLFADGYGKAIQDLGQNRSTAIDTRSLSVTSLSGSSLNTDERNATTNLALLYFEDDTGNVSALLQHVINNYTRWGLVQWVDITSQNEHHGSLPDASRVDEFSNGPNFDPLVGYSHTLYESAANITLSAPFASKANFLDILDEGTTNWTTVGAVFYAPGSASLVTDDFGIDLSGPGNFTSVSGYRFSSPWPSTNSGPDGSSHHLNHSLISQSDVATVGLSDAIWINGTQPVTYQNAPPNVSFPFTRLASANSADKSKTFLYHQINGTTFAEEQWDESLKLWVATEYITLTGDLGPGFTQKIFV